MWFGQRARVAPRRVLAGSTLLKVATLWGIACTGCTGDIEAGSSVIAEHPGDSRRASSDDDGEAGNGDGARAPGDGPTAQDPEQPEGGGADPGAPVCDDTRVDVGATPLQRLSRAQYVHAVRDLLKVTLDASDLPEDEQHGVFAGNTVAPVTDLVIEQYIGAAEQAARLALPELETIVPCDRAALGDLACAQRLIASFGLRAYRRPLEPEERGRYETLFTTFGSEQYTEGARVVAQTMLQSPNFLYRVELVPVALAGGETVAPLDAYELATRLSFFLLSTTPDDELLDAARSGALSSPDALAVQVDRLLDDPKLSDTLASFHLQWLELGGLDRLSKDPELFPAFSSELGATMREETLRFIDYVVREGDATFASLLTAPYSFPRGPLLELYGLDADTASRDGQPIMLDPQQRAGLLTQPSFLAAHAHYDQASPVQRGKVVIRNVLCQPLPDPPPNVNAIPPEPAPDATTRERLVEHQSDPSCAGCHRRIDGIGFGFESFDALGAFRSEEAGKPIDATGEIYGTPSSDATFDGAVELARELADSADAQRCFAQQWLHFALGRPDVDADRCSIDRLDRQFAASGGDIRGLLRAIALSDAFRSKRIVEVSTP
jgi:hypothetical protein